MQFKDLIIGQQFKPIGDDRVYTKGTYAGMYLSSQEAVASYAHHNNNWVWFPSEYIVRTLQKVKKTEKKWVEKELGEVLCGSYFKFGESSAYLACKKLDRGFGIPDYFGYYVNSRDLVCRMPNKNTVYVEEDTVVETEEWLP